MTAPPPTASAPPLASLSPPDAAPAPPTASAADAAPGQPARAEGGADATRLLRHPAHRVLARLVGTDALHADLTACIDNITAAVHASPTVIPPELAGVLTGGKRLRPLLVFATAHAVRGSTPPVRRRAIVGATAVELLHLASLVHDDIMDNADIRHGTGTINARVGNDSALLAGDLLLAHAHATAAGLGAGAARLIGESLVQLCEGQAREMATRYDVSRTEESYFRCVAGKTGALTEAACRLGAVAARCDPATTQVLGRFGHHLGVAFQLADDLFDLVGWPGDANKPVGHDLTEGVFTYPTLWAARRDPVLRRMLRELEGRPPGSVDAVVKRICAIGAPEAARRAITDAHARCLHTLSDTDAALSRAGRELLTELARTILAPADPPSTSRA